VGLVPARFTHYDSDVNFNIEEMTAVPPVTDDVFTWPGEPRLRGGRCRDCHTAAFPLPQGCTRCSGRSIDEELLPTEGTLWSWTVQSFRPKAPFRGVEPFEPYGVGYVELPGACIVESRLTTADPDRLQIGCPMRLTVIPFATDADGAELLTYAFAPVGDES
jgi:uncharacterized protein